MLNTSATEFLKMQMTGQQLTTDQIRNLAIQKTMEQFIIYDEETSTPIGLKDPLIHVLPKNDEPSKTVRVNAKQAAEMIVDKKAIVATKEQESEYNIENEDAKMRIQKQLDRNDLAKAMNRLVKD